MLGRLGGCFSLSRKCKDLAIRILHCDLSVFGIRPFVQTWWRIEITDSRALGKSMCQNEKCWWVTCTVGMIAMIVEVCG